MVLSHLKRDEIIDKHSPIPMYYQIMNQLREKIAEGVYNVGDALPPERELVEVYQVSRMTIRQAIYGVTELQISNIPQVIATKTRWILIPTNKIICDQLME